MLVTFLDPRAEPGTPVEPYLLGIDVTDRPVTIGLLANGFPDSENFLFEIETALAEALPQATFKHFNKRNASANASDEMLAALATQCDAVVSAYGH